MVLALSKFVELLLIKNGNLNKGGRGMKSKVVEVILENKHNKKQREIWREELKEVAKLAMSLDDVSDVECVIRRAVNMLTSLEVRVRKESRKELLFEFMKDRDGLFGYDQSEAVGDKCNEGVCGDESHNHRLIPAFSVFSILLPENARKWWGEIRVATGKFIGGVKLDDGGSIEILKKWQYYSHKYLDLIQEGKDVETLSNYLMRTKG